MNIDDMIAGMTPEVYQRLVTAVELGNGRTVWRSHLSKKRTACSW